MPSIFGKSKEPDVESMTPGQMGNWYLDQAMEFEVSKTTSARASAKLAWRCVGAALALAGVAVIASAVVVCFNKPNPPAVMMVNEKTGEVTMLKTLADGKVNYGKATDIKYLRDYIKYRESYDWETIQDDYNATLLLSSVSEGNLYASFNADTNATAPVNILKNHFRVIASGGTIAFVGDTALVSFTKKTIPLSGQRPTVEYFVATIAYEYVNQAMDDRDRGINVAGFKVNSYRVDRDVTRSAAVSDAATGSNP